MWNASTPLSSSSASLADDTIRSDLTAIEAALGTAFYWPGAQGSSAASSGVLRPESHRCVEVSVTDATASHGNGTISMSTVPSTNYPARLKHTGVAGSLLLGHAAAAIHESTPASGAVWTLHSFVTSTVVESGVSGAVFQYGTTFSDTPVVVLSLSNISFWAGLSTVSVSGFSSLISYLGPGSPPAASTVTLFVTTLGPRSI